MKKNLLILILTTNILGCLNHIPDLSDNELLNYFHNTTLTTQEKEHYRLLNGYWLQPTYPDRYIYTQHTGLNKIPGNHLNRLLEISFNHPIEDKKEPGILKSYLTVNRGKKNNILFYKYQFVVHENLIIKNSLGLYINNQKIKLSEKSKLTVFKIAYISESELHLIAQGENKKLKFRRISIEKANAYLNKFNY